MTIILYKRLKTNILENCGFYDNQNAQAWDDLLKKINKHVFQIKKLKNSWLPLRLESEIYVPGSFIVSSVNFKHNHRYFSFVKSDSKIITFFPGRELVLIDNLKYRKLQKLEIRLDEIIGKSIYGGLNSYESLDSSSIFHVLLFDPLFLHFNKTIFKHMQFFFDLPESSSRFCHFTFKQSKIVLKKTSSIKKNFRKKRLKLMKKKDYTLITL